MSSSVENSELVAFGAFIELLNTRGETMTAEEALVSFRSYQEQLSNFKEAILPAVKELDAEKGKVLNMNAIIREGKQMLASPL